MVSQWLAFSCRTQKTRTALVCAEPAHSLQAASHGAPSCNCRTLGFLSCAPQTWGGAVPSLPIFREDPWGELTIPCPSVFVGTENQSSLPVYGIGSGFPQGGYGRCQEVRGVYHVKTQTFPHGIRWVSLADLTVIHVSVKTARCSSLTCGGYVPAPQYVAKTLL